MDSSLGAIALGFVFGLQHATDADHVVAEEGGAHPHVEHPEGH